MPNLKPWKPGQSGNPGGRPSYRPTTDAARRWMNANADALIDAIGQRALAGDLAAARFIAERAEGEVPKDLVRVLEVDDLMNGDNPVIQAMLNRMEMIVGGNQGV